MLNCNLTWWKFKWRVKKKFFSKKIHSIIRSRVNEIILFYHIGKYILALKISSLTTSLGFGRSPFCAAWITGWGGEGQTRRPFLTMCWMGAGGGGGHRPLISMGWLVPWPRPLWTAAVSRPALLSDIKSALIERLRHFASLIWHRDNAIIRQQQLEENFWQDQ